MPQAAPCQEAKFVHNHPSPGDEVGQDVVSPGEPDRERFHESAELARAYQEARRAYLAASAAFAELQQAHREGRYQGPEVVEFDARSADLRESVRLTRLKASAEI